MNVKSKGQKARETEGYPLRKSQDGSANKRGGGGHRVGGNASIGQGGGRNGGSLVNGILLGHPFTRADSTEAGRPHLGGCVSLSLRLSPSFPLRGWHSLPLHPGNAVSIEPEHPGARLYRFLHFMIYHAAFSPARAQSARARELRWPESAQIDKRNNGGCEIGGTRSDIAGRGLALSTLRMKRDVATSERSGIGPTSSPGGLDLRCRHKKRILFRGLSYSSRGCFSSSCMYSGSNSFSLALSFFYSFPDIIPNAIFYP